MIKNKLSFLTILVIIFLISLNVSAQAPDTTAKKTAKDSVKLDFITRMQAFAKKSAKKSADEFEADKADMIQNRTFEEIKRTMQKAKSYLKKGVDTVGTKTRLTDITRDFKIAGDGVLTKQGTAQTFRNLTASSKIISEL